MPNSRELERSTDFLGTLGEAIHTQEAYNEQAALRTITHTRIDDARSIDLLAEQGMELGGILALLLERNQITGAPEAKTRRGWDLRHLLGQHRAQPLEVTKDGVLLTQKTNPKSFGIAGLVVAAILMLGQSLSGVSTGLFLQCLCLGALVCLGAVFAGLACAVVEEQENSTSALFILLSAFVLGGAATWMWPQIPGGHTLRVAIATAATLVASGIAMVWLPSVVLKRMFGWTTASPGIDYDKATLEQLASRIKPELARLGQTLPESLDGPEGRKAKTLETQGRLKASA